MNRTIDEHLLMDLADQLGLSDQSQNRRSSSPQTASSVSGHSVDFGSFDGVNFPREAREAAEAMKGRSDSEILSEIMKLKSHLQKNPGTYEKQIRAVKSLRGMMNPEQRQRLDQVLKLLEER